MRSDYERFIDKVEQVPEAGCWLWTGSTYRRGYGHFRKKINGKWVMYKAHRFSYEYHNGEIPNGLSVLHSCDVTCCVNPHHLFVGTTQDNIQDKVEKGRQSFGRNRAHQWLDYEMAERFREGWRELQGTMHQKDYAKALGISRRQISRILRNEIWVTPERGGENSLLSL